MAYRDILLREEVHVLPAVHDIYVPWEELDVHLKTKTFSRVVQPPSFQPKEKEYQVLVENDHLLHDITKELKERFEMKGLMRECNMTRLMEIFTKNMRLEEILYDDDLEEDPDEDGN